MIQPMSVARAVKHRGFVLRKRARQRAKKAKFDAATVAFKAMPERRPFRYNAARYADTFLADDPAIDGTSEFPSHAFVVWAGENEMSANRQRSLHLISERIGLPLRLVTPATLDEWLVPGHPLPAGYEHLSLVHRSDYLRGYLMHHHGGAYLDVKEPMGSWLPSYRQMAEDPSIWVTSYRTTHANWIGKLRGPLGRDILINYRLMFGKGALMMRSHTPLTAAWVARMDTIIDRHASALAAHPGGVSGDDGEYPLSWTDLLARVLDPLTLKHLEHVAYDDRLLLSFENYR